MAVERAVAELAVPLAHRVHETEPGDEDKEPGAHGMHTCPPGTG